MFMSLNYEIYCWESKFGTRENGFCVLSNGADQNNGVKKSDPLILNGDQCLKWCESQKDLTGCEFIWNQGNKGCYAHHESVSRGNGRANHYCWIANPSNKLNLPNFQQKWNLKILNIIVYRGQQKPPTKITNASPFETKSQIYI